MIKLSTVPGVKQTPDEIRQTPLFQIWADGLGSGWTGTVIVNAVDYWGGEIHALQVTVRAEDQPWPEMFTLRSETVDVLAIVTDGTQRYVAFVKQWRNAVGRLVTSNVAGGKEWSETAVQAANRELIEELGLNDTNIPFSVKVSRLIQPVAFASPGITNEGAHMMVAELGLSSDDLPRFIEELEGKKTGVTEEGEDITLEVVKSDNTVEHVLHSLGVDTKTLLSLSLAKALGKL